MQPSTYQTNILHQLQTTDKNVVIDAKAGSGKTTTLKLAVGVFPEWLSLACVAFNRDIAAELSQKLPQHVDVKTCHSLGFAAIRKNTPNVKTNNNKAREALQFLFPGWDEYRGLQASEFKDDVDAILRLVDLCRLNMSTDVGTLCDRYDIDNFPGLAAKVQQVIKSMSFNTHEVDFVDMIYLPASSDAYSPKKYDVILVDECQDISAAQRALILKSLAPGGRTVWVGDPYQAIYGFAGADAESFTTLTAMPNTVTMPLNECYRCGKNIIRYAQRIVPEIVAYEGNADGVVNEKASVSEVEPGDMVLCRMTAPLVSLTYKFIADGKPAYVRGRDIGKNLINLVQKSKAVSKESLQFFLNRERARLMAKHARLNPQMDMAEIKALPALCVFEDSATVIGIISDQITDAGPVFLSIIRDIEKIFRDDAVDKICLSTIHRAKGLESKRVYILERELMPAKWAKKPWERVQELNLEYVAYTRAIEYLGFISDWSSKNEDLVE